MTDYPRMTDESPEFHYWDDDEKVQRVKTGANVLISLVNDGVITKDDLDKVGFLAFSTCVAHDVEEE